MLCMNIWRAIPFEIYFLSTQIPSRKLVCHNILFYVRLLILFFFRERCDSRLPSERMGASCACSFTGTLSSLLDQMSAVPISLLRIQITVICHFYLTNYSECLGGFPLFPQFWFAMPQMPVSFTWGFMSWTKTKWIKLPFFHQNIRNVAYTQSWLRWQKVFGFCLLSILLKLSWICEHKC